MTDSKHEKREIQFTVKSFFVFFLTFMLALSFFAYQINILENTNLILSEKLAQLEEKQTELQSFLEKNYGVSSLEELEQKLKMRYTGNPFTTELWSGQLQAENITGMHWYTYLSGVLQNRTDVLAYPEQTATFIIWNDTSTNDVYAKNTTSGQIQYGGAWDAGGVDGANGTAVIQACANSLSSGGTILIKNSIDLGSSGLVINKNGVYIKGEGKNKTVISYSGTGDAIRFEPSSGRGLYGGVEDLTINLSSGARSGLHIKTFDFVEVDVAIINIPSGGYGVIIDGSFLGQYSIRAIGASTSTPFVGTGLLMTGGGSTIISGTSSTRANSNVIVRFYGEYLDVLLYLDAAHQNIINLDSDYTKYGIRLNDAYRNQIYGNMEFQGLPDTVGLDFVSNQNGLSASPSDNYLVLPLILNCANKSRGHRTNGGHGNVLFTMRYLIMDMANALMPDPWDGSDLGGTFASIVLSDVRGTPSDNLAGSLDAGMVYDSVNHRVWIRDGGTWYYVNLTAG
ncbi:MAG: hypothetical protein DRH17_13420 [Deltaproteobacteria bacterium]|nr:MAG: hypothetical protein DRH17_13420 [Deltaproteobacteria bacterium]